MSGIGDWWDSVVEWANSLPWWGIALVFFLGVTSRAHGTFWIGWLARRGGEKSRWHKRFNNQTLERARDYLDRWGWIGVPLSFLTVGFQSMVLGAAGFGKMNYVRFTLAAIPGCAAWAIVYTTLGLTLWAAIVRFGEQSPWLLAQVVILLVVVIMIANYLRREDRPEADAS